MVAVAPPWLRGVPAAAAGPAAAITPAAASPQTRNAAVRRPAPRLRVNGAAYEAHTEFPFEQDPLTWGRGPTSRISKPTEPVRHPRDHGHHYPLSYRQMTDPTRNRYRRRTAGELPGYGGGTVREPSQATAAGSR
ncbi:hypothetical protein GCM10010510_33770 [Streptomyces anandii JCM 4720]|nr:hypothetical protein GCM10010510_33770 [Streptomyces anandii JCM 4720]